MPSLTWKPTCQRRMGMCFAGEACAPGKLIFQVFTAVLFPEDNVHVEQIHVKLD